MNLSTIEQGEELYRLVSGSSYSPSANKAFSTWLQANASELLQMAREVEGMKRNAQNVLMSLPITPIVLKHNGNVADVVFEPGSITPSEDSK
jgi:hypothetical protein